MSDEFENDYDDFDAGFESEEQDTTNGLDDTTDAVSAVSDILLGKDSPSGSSREGRSINVTDVDASGKPDYATNSQESEAPAYDSNRSAPDGSTAARLEQHTGAMRQAEQAVADIQDRLRNGEINQRDAQQAMDYARGVWAGNQIRALEAQNEQMQEHQWLSNQVEAVRREHKDIWDDPAKKEHYQQAAIDYLGSIGYSRGELSEIGARELNAVLTMVKTQEENQKLKNENNRHRTQNRRRKQSQGKGRRDMQTGNRRSSGSGAVHDEVARILMGGGK